MKTIRVPNSQLADLTVLDLLTADSLRAAVERACMGCVRLDGEIEFAADMFVL